MTIVDLYEQLPRIRARLGPLGFSTLQGHISDVVQVVEHSDALERYKSKPQVSPFILAGLIVKRIQHDAPKSLIAELTLSEQIAAITAMLICQPPELHEIELCVMDPGESVEQVVKDFARLPLASE